MKKTLLLTSFLIPSFANGAVGFFGSYINVTTHTSALWYDLTPPGGGRASDPADFAGHDFGTFDPGTQTLTLTGAEGLTFKNSGGDVTGINFNYSIQPTGGTHVFTEVGVGFSNNATFADAAGTTYSGGGDQKWSDSSGWAPVDILSGLADGTYEIQVFLRGTSNEGDFFASNGGSNYTATFTVAAVPEPSSALLGSLALIGLIRRRR
ncbi:PEP-CTERM sorting domain-containing protein [Akkermansiaceae bacterium]|nr:PEP-CTERM sorting domain-containing protein [Akkermansiaceae bacterium]